MLISKVTLDVLEKDIEKLNKIRKEKFWSNDLLSQSDKTTMKYCIFQQYLLWLFSLAVLISFTITTFSHPAFVYQSDWSSLAKKMYRSWFFFYVVLGYYFGNSSVTIIGYTTLHSYFQVKIISLYIRKELKKYVSIPFNEKSYSESYQEAVHEILLRSIHQYQILRELLQERFVKNFLLYSICRYMVTYSGCFNKLASFHFFTGIPILSVGIHSTLFVSIVIY